MNRHLFLGLSMLGALFLLEPVQAQTTTIGSGQIVNYNSSVMISNINFTSDFTTFGADAGGTGLGAGLLYIPGTFTESLGTGVNQIQWTGSGGFIAPSDENDLPPLNVNIGGLTTPATLTWGQGGFVPNGSALLLDNVYFENSINLGTNPNTVALINFTSPSSSFGSLLTGNISGSGSLNVNSELNEAEILGTINITGPLTLSGEVFVLGSSVQAASFILTNRSEIVVPLTGSPDLTLSGSGFGSNFNVTAGTVLTQSLGNLNGDDESGVGLGGYVADGLNTGAYSRVLTVHSGYYAGYLEDQLTSTESAANPIFGGSLIKDGPGIFTLANDNDYPFGLINDPSYPFIGYTQGTTVKQGTLLVTNTTGSATSTGPVTVMSGGLLGGTGIIAPTGTNSIDVQSGGGVDLTVFDPAHPPTSSTATLTFQFSGTNTATFESGSTFAFNLGTSSTSNTLAFTGLVANEPQVVFNDNPVTLKSLSAVGPGTYTLFTFDQIGAYSGTLANGPNYSFTYEPNAILVTTVDQNFASWERQPGFFTTQQLNNFAISGLTATPQNDGVPNLLKYLYDINPTRPMTAADRAGLPIFATTSSGGTSYLTLTYGQYAFSTGITVNVQTSPDLITWTTLNSSQYTNQPTGKTDPNGDPYMQIVAPFTGSRQFLRLNVSTP